MITCKEQTKDLIRHLEGALFSVEKPMPHKRGKVRDMFLVGQLLYMVNTDRISAFDHVLGTVPLKGALLCEQTDFWFDFTRGICPNHLIDRPDPQILVCNKAQPLPVEVIVRGFLAGSLMREDKNTRGSAYGLRLDPTLKDYAPFEAPIITPTTKAPLGEHDEPISAHNIVEHGLVTKTHWQVMEEYALELFKACSIKAQSQGLLLVDTKYEFGLIGGKVHLIDEVHTSDSSRFFIKSDYEDKFKNQKTPIMLDKEFLRQHLLATVDKKSEFFKNPTLSDEIRIEVAKRYLMLTEKITGRTFIAPKTTASDRVHQRLLELIC